MTQPANIQQLDRNLAPPAVDAQTELLIWHDIRDLGVEGRAFADTASFYDRFPARAMGVVRDPVWQLSQRSAGMYVTFETDATAIHARWQLRFESLAMPHMPATGVSGLDLYGWTGTRWLFAGAARPERWPENETSLSIDLDGARRVYRVYLPLYNGVEQVALGLPAQASFRRVREPGDPQAENRKPMLFYGTSILQGGCASRPGMAYPAILGRRLLRPTFNFGFSGNAQCEPEVARLLAELNSSIYVLDPLPNMTAPMITERVEPFVRTLREARPATPIVLVESVTYQDAQFRPARLERYTSSNAALREAFERLQAAGIPGLTLVPGEELFGSDMEATVDGTHASDLGFLRMAERLEPVLRPLV